MKVVYIMDIMSFGEKLLLGIAYGDAFGLPYETADYDPGREVTGLGPVVQNKYLGELPVGTWSDDTHLSIAVAGALIQEDSFDLDTIADYHVRALDLVGQAELTNEMLSPAFVTGLKRKNGFGKSTLDAIARLRDGVPAAESGSKEGLGNGVLMKMAPLVAWQAARRIDPVDQASQIERLTNMTHNNDESVRQARRYARILQTMQTCLLAPEGGYASEEELIAATPKRGFTAWETLEVALFYFKKEMRFPENIRMAVKYGGDADSICSILGAMSAFAGTFSEPEDARRLHDYWRLRYIGKVFDGLIGA